MNALYAMDPVLRLSFGRWAGSGVQEVRDPLVLYIESLRLSTPDYRDLRIKLYSLPVVLSFSCSR